MSIFFDFEVGSSGRRFRKAVDGDKDNIQLFVDSSHHKLFGEVDIGGLIELSTLSICMINENHEVLGFMALCDHPNVPGVDPADWEIWIRNLFQIYYLARNTLFIHFMCCVKEVEEFFMEEALVSVFYNDVYIVQIVMMVPRKCPEDCYLKYPTFKKRVFHKYDVKKCEDVNQSLFFYAALRREFCPKLTIRRAVEEDNDDITEILDRKCTRLKQLYGDFYISEIIGRHPDMGRKIIVADRQSVAVGVMCLNSNINYENLQSTYELEPYHGLIKNTALEKEQNRRSNKLLKSFGEPIMLGHWTPFEQISKLETTQHIEDVLSKEKLVELKPRKSPSRVNFVREVSESDIDNFYIRHKSSEEYDEKSYTTFPHLESKSVHSIIDLLEEDPFDYEIVNIDTNLLTIPESLSYDTVYV